MKTAIGLVVLILILPFLVNIPDEKLLDEAEKVITSSPESTNPQRDNGFYALLGFKAPIGKDIYEAGQDAASAYSQSQAGQPPRFEFSLEKIIAPVPEMANSNPVPQCAPEKGECLRYYAEKEGPLVRVLGENGLLLERYRSLRKYAFFQDTTKPAPWAPQIKVEGAIFAGHLLTVGQAAVLFNKGNHEEGLQLLVTDILLWRKLLAGAAELPGKIYSLRALRLNYSLLGEMFDKISPKKAAAMIQQDWLASLSTVERSTDLVWDRHFRALAWSLAHHRWPLESGQEAKMSFGERCFCKFNATLNDAYSMFHLLKKFSRVEPGEVEKVREAFSQRLGEFTRLSPYHLYNPVGKKFVSVSFDARVGVDWNRDIHSLDQLISRIRGRVKNEDEKVTSAGGKSRP